jgi:addiction module HigA family antidote
VPDGPKPLETLGKSGVFGENQEGNSFDCPSLNLEEYLQPMGISQNAMARAIGVPPRAINEIVLGKRSITPSMSIRFGAFFGQSEDF